MQVENFGQKVSFLFAATNFIHPCRISKLSMTVALHASAYDPACPQASSSLSSRSLGAIPEILSASFCDSLLHTPHSVLSCRIDRAIRRSTRALLHRPENKIRIVFFVGNYIQT